MRKKDSKIHNKIMRDSEVNKKVFIATIRKRLHVLIYSGNSNCNLIALPGEMKAIVTHLLISDLSARESGPQSYCTY